MTQVKAKKHGSRWEGQFQFGTYWFGVKSGGGRVVMFASAKAARAAAEKAAPKGKP